MQIITLLGFATFVQAADLLVRQGGWLWWGREGGGGGAGRVVVVGQGANMYMYVLLGGGACYENA